MNRILRTLFLLTGLTLIFSGCFEITEEIFLEKGGSGKYVLSYDMSALMDPSLQEMLKGMGGEEMDGMQDLSSIEMDSAIRLADMNPELLKEISRPEVFKNAVMYIDMSASRQTMVMKMEFPFEELSDIDYFNENLNDFMGNQMAAGGMMGGGLIPTAARLFKLKGRKLTRLPQESQASQLSDEEMQMAEMMLGSGTYKTVYHFPGKVRKTTIPGAVIEGNTLTVETSLLDMMKGKANLAGDIKFKW